MRGGFSSLMQKWLLRFALHVRSDRIPGKRIARTRPRRVRGSRRDGPGLPGGGPPARTFPGSCTLHHLAFFLSYLLINSTRVAALVRPLSGEQPSRANPRPPDDPL